MRKISLLIFFLLFSSGYVTAEDVILSGDMKVSEPIYFKEKKVTILPSTKIKIDNNLDSGLIFDNCNIIFNGTSKNPIIVEGYGSSIDLEDKNLIHIEDSELVIKNTIFKNGSWYLHIHHSKGVIENSFFYKGYGAIRFTGDNIKIMRNIFSENNIAVRFIKAEPILENNIFYKNEIAIFLREGVQSPVIQRNSFVKNKFDLYGGFFQEKDINIYNNFFYDRPAIFDKEIDSSLKFKIIPNDNLEYFPDWH